MSFIYWKIFVLEASLHKMYCVILLIQCKKFSTLEQKAPRAQRTFLLEFIKNNKYYISNTIFIHTYFRFDEMHYGKYANLYLKKTFFFDANPPLGKLLIALAGYLYGYDGSSEFGFDKIGTPYPEDVPHVVFRLVPALFGSLLTPTVFLILCELKVTVFAGYLASFMIVFGKSPSVQTPVS